MKKIFIFFIGIFLSANAFAESYIDTVLGGSDYNIIENTIISKNSIIESNNLNIKNSLYLENYGNIYSNIYVDDGFELQLQNSGSITGDIHLGENSDLVQIIKNSDDINLLNADAPFSIIVQNDNWVSMSDLVGISESAENIMLDDAKIYLDYFGTLPKNIQLSGETVIRVNDINSALNNFYLTGVSTDGSITVLADGLNPLYSIQTIYDDDKIYLNLYRETDYQKILGIKNGSMVNSLRTSSLNNKLLASMDRAGSMSEIYEIMQKSIVFNPINLMKPIKTFNNFESVPFKNRRSQTVGLQLSPIYIVNNDMNMLVGKASLSISKNNWKLLLSGYFGNFTQSDDINDFGGSFYGANIKWGFSSRKIFTDILLGYTGAAFKTSGVLNGDKMIQNPTGKSLYGNIDTGIKMYFGDLYISPFAGFGANQTSVLNDEESDVYARIGGSAGFGFQDLGLRYDYGIFMSGQTDNIQSIGIKMDIWSFLDGAGGGMSYEILNNESGMHNKISANIKFVF